MEHIGTHTQTHIGTHTIQKIDTTNITQQTNKLTQTNKNMNNN